MRTKLIGGCVVAALMTIASTAPAQTMDPYYAGSYTYTDIGEVPGLPSQYGGLTFMRDNPDMLIIGGAANTASGRLYRIGVQRDSGNHVTGFAGAVTDWADGAFNDGGVVYGPGGVLFLARWPSNEIGQMLPGSTATDKIVALGSLGVVASPGGLMFVPADHAAAGAFKLVSWSGGQFYTLSLAPDGAGTYDITAAVLETTLAGGPEGFIYVPIGSNLFPNPSMLVSEYSAGQVGAYETDTQGNPIVGTRRTFLSGLTGAEGAVIDPMTGDYLFSTFGGGNHVVVIKGFALPPGAPCVAGVDCGSGFCADGVCCNTACDGGACDACSVPAGAQANGTCEALSGASCDDGNACSGQDTCESGACIGAPVDCVPTNECQESLGCEPSSGCQEEAKADGTPCTGGVCSGGVCDTGSGGAAGAAGSSGQGGTAGSGGAGGAAGGAGSGGAGGGTGTGGGATGGTGGATGGTGGTTGGTAGTGASAAGGGSGSGVGAEDEGDDGGCGCRTSASGGGRALPWAVFAIVLFAFRRRQRGLPN